MNKRRLLVSVGLIILALVSAFVAMWKSLLHDQHSNAKVPEVINHRNELTKTRMPASPSTAPSSDRAEKTRDFIDAANVSIQFWGKVVDESGVGVSGVHIVYLIQRAGRMEANGLIVQDDVRGNLVSSEDGSFSITNARGTTLSMECFTKVGYEFSSNQHSVFGYFGTPEIHTPSHMKPHVFVMQSSKQPLDVKKTSQDVRLPWDGRPIRIDLDSCTVSPSGALIITATRTASTGHFGWGISLTIDGGDLQEAPAGSAFIAPVEGYLPDWQCGYAPNANPWRFGHDANVYYRQKGKFGRLKLQIYADAGPSDVSVHLEAFVNMSGTRSTEGRP
jgi:hypothetical protein